MASWMNNDAPGVVQFHIKSAEIQEDYHEKFKSLYATVYINDVSVSTEVTDDTAKPTWHEVLTFIGYIPSTSAQYTAQIVVKDRPSDELVGLGSLELAHKFDPATDFWESQFVNLDNSNIESTRANGYLMGFIEVSMRTVCDAHYKKEPQSKSNKSVHLMPQNNGCCVVL
mmetsp:Transcript_5955/g.9899  ORF Transcript_5955/g.9899 Transcript_5955/m.9899 type:complete len:170 (-) Transcript_5955:141-650(-)